ncbi:MAG: hypothetical protein JW915_10865 [Chitinispirillaceae bacterium]|nr:hypothetical protein [Chitinispirillaceae bacterium]
MPRINNRTSPFSESFILCMTRLAQQTGAINLSQGFPDFDPPSELLSALKKASIDDPDQYTITWGACNIMEHRQRNFSILWAFPSIRKLLARKR